MINVVVLFLVCMLSLQAPVRRGEERLDIDEQISIFGPSGIISTGRTKEISLSGTGIEADKDRALSVRLGDAVRVFITDVGFIAGKVVRQNGQFLGVQFNLPASIERDLLMRKLFTSGLNTTDVSCSAWSATWSMLKSIWDMRMEMLEHVVDRTSDVVIALPTEKLPAQTLVILPRPQSLRPSNRGVIDGH
jgi:cellulose synthase (UDP-forming)